MALPQCLLGARRRDVTHHPVHSSHNPEGLLCAYSGPGTVRRAKEVTNLQKPSLGLPFLWRMESTRVLRHQAA